MFVIFFNFFFCVSLSLEVIILRHYRHNLSKEMIKAGIDIKTEAVIKVAEVVVMVTIVTAIVIETETETKEKKRRLED